MRFKYLEEDEYTEVSAGMDDNCFYCEYFDICPLIQALTLNIVYPSAEKLTITECPIYLPNTDFKDNDGYNFN